jgi:hypothetical protein
LQETRRPNHGELEGNARDRPTSGFEKTSEGILFAPHSDRARVGIASRKELKHSQPNTGEGPIHNPFAQGADYSSEE